MTSIDDSAVSGLIYLRGQGETTWQPHRGVAWLRETPAGLEVGLDDALRECARQHRPGLVLLGHPASGKSEALQRMASLCREGRGARLGLPDDVGPIVVDLAAWRPAAGPVASWLEARADAPTGLLLVDGLDRLEVDDRRAAAQWLRRWAAVDRRLVVTCRFDAYEAETALGGAFLEVQLVPGAPLDTVATKRLDVAALADRARPAGDGAVRARDGSLLATVPSGSFVMGSPEDEPERWADEGPQRRVDVAPFHLATTPVTNRAFQRFLRAQPAETPSPYRHDPRFNGDDQPVVGVGWEQARRYAAWAGARLPSEAEWEYACRAGTVGARYGALDAVAWHGGNSGGALRPVGTRAPNAWGLFDMLGNAWEWVEDDHHPSYEGAPLDGRAWVDRPRGAHRLLRGGSWADNPRTVRAATRLTDHPGPRVGNVGFRLAADLRAP